MEKQMPSEGERQAYQPSQNLSQGWPSPILLPRWNMKLYRSFHMNFFFFSYELLKSLFRILALEISFPRKIIKLSFYFRLFNLQESTHDNEYINLLSFSLNLSNAVLVLLHLGSHQSLSNSKINPLEVVIPINSLYWKFNVKACWRWSVGLLLICWSYRETYFGSI